MIERFPNLPTVTMRNMIALTTISKNPLTARVNIIIGLKMVITVASLLTMCPSS